MNKNVKKCVIFFEEKKKKGSSPTFFRHCRSDSVSMFTFLFLLQCLLCFVRGNISQNCTLYPSGALNVTQPFANANNTGFSGFHCLVFLFLRTFYFVELCTLTATTNVVLTWQHDCVANATTFQVTGETPGWLGVAFVAASKLNSVRKYAPIVVVVVFAARF